MSEVWASDELIRQTKAGVELWLPVVNGDGWYDVSNMGQVRTWIKRGHQARVRMAEPRLLNATLNGPPSNSTYPCVTVITEAGTRLYRPVHVFELEAFVGPRPGPQWDGGHWDGNSMNNRLDNVRWCTKSVNSGEDKQRHGTSNLRECQNVDGEKQYQCTRCSAWKSEVEFRAISVPGSICGRASACIPCDKIGCRRKRAFRTTCCGVTSVVAAKSAAEAKAITMRAALEVYDRRQVKYTEVRAVRVKEHDAWAESDSTGRIWDEKQLPAAAKVA